MSAGNPHILLVEDDEDLAEALSQALELAGMRSRIALNGRVALRAIEQEVPRLILLDLMMPEMDGWQFREEQKRRPEMARIPVIVMTAGGHAQGKAGKLEANGYLDKPVSIEALLAEVRRVLSV